MANLDDLVQLKKQLAKALAKKDTNAVMDLLSEFRSTEPTETQLKSTRVGLFIQRLIKHDDPDVVASAKLTLSKWKLGETKTETKTPTNNEDEPTLPNKRKMIEIKPKIAKNASRTRVEKSIFTNISKKAANIPKEEIEQLASDIEEALHSNYEGPEYNSRLRELNASIRHSKNQWLVDALVDSSIPPQKFVVMSVDELQSPEERERRKELLEQFQADIQTIKPLGTRTDMFTCSKCKRSECNIERQLQTRSADEPMTLFLQCMNCGNRWKQ